MPSTITSVEPSKYIIIVPLYVPIGIPSRSPSVVPSTFPSENTSSLPTFVPSSIPSRNPSQAPRNNPSRLLPVVPSVDLYPSYVPSYVPSVNRSRDPSEQQVGALQEKRWTTFEQVKPLENIISSREIKADEADLLWKLYIIKLKLNIFMLETSVNKFLQGKKCV